MFVVFSQEGRTQRGFHGNFDALEWIGKYFSWSIYGVREIKKTQKNFSESLLFLEPTSGFEPETPSLPWMCSTYWAKSAKRQLNKLVNDIIQSYFYLNRIILYVNNCVCQLRKTHLSPDNDNVPNPQIKDSTSRWLFEKTVLSFCCEAKVLHQRGANLLWQKKS